MVVVNTDDYFVSLVANDGKVVSLPASAAVHSKYLRERFFDENGARKEGDQGPISLEDNRSCLAAALHHAITYLKLCDVMSRLPSSGYSMADEGVNLATMRTPSIYAYLGIGTTLTPWEQALSAYATSVGTLSDDLLVHLMYTAEVLLMRGLRDTVVLQLSIRIERGTRTEILAITKLGDRVFIDALMAMCKDYATSDEELALQCVRALVVLVLLGFAHEMRTLEILTLPEVARCYPLEKETSRALLKVTAKMGAENVLKNFMLLWDNLDPVVRQYGMMTFLFIDPRQWTPLCTEAVFSRLAHDHSERRIEFLRAARRLGPHITGLPLCIKDKILHLAMTDAEMAGHVARKIFKDKVKACFFCDDDGQMLLRDLPRWWVLVKIALVSATQMLNAEELIDALALSPDEPSRPFRLFLQAIFPAYSHRKHADNLSPFLLEFYKTLPPLDAQEGEQDQTGGGSREEGDGGGEKQGDGGEMARDSGPVRTGSEQGVRTGREEKQGQLMRVVVVLALGYAAMPMDSSCQCWLAQVAENTVRPQAAHDRVTRAPQAEKAEACIPTSSGMGDTGDRLVGVLGHAARGNSGGGGEEPAAKRLRVTSADRLAGAEALPELLRRSSDRLQGVVRGCVQAKAEQEGCGVGVVPVFKTAAVSIKSILECIAC